mgnify:CR=1 FL=1
MPDWALRSYVLRRGRTRPAWRAAYEREKSHLLPFCRHFVDFETTFGRMAPVVLEIGFGMGESLVAQARACPETNFLGVEVHTPGVARTLKEISCLGLANLRLIEHDAIEVLSFMIAPASLWGVQIFFPDPWPKKRHHKRRLVTAPFASLVQGRLLPGGFLHFATDFRAYGLFMQSLFQAYFSEAPPPPLLQSKFARRAAKAGMAVQEGFFRRLPRLGLQCQGTSETLRAFGKKRTPHPRAGG